LIIKKERKETKNVRNDSKWRMHAVCKKDKVSWKMRNNARNEGEIEETTRMTEVDS
jgi:hypothetical protein